MREIKFRVWDKEGKEMLVYGKRQIGWMCPIDRPAFPCEEYVFSSKADGYSGLQWCLDNPESFVVMQFTGLFDTKGKEIWEGDRVRITGDDFFSNNSFSVDRTEDDCWEFIGKVDMSSDGYWLCADKDESVIAFFEIEAEDLEVEVIGNIYEC